MKLFRKSGNNFEIDFYQVFQKGLYKPLSAYIFLIYTVSFENNQIEKMTRMNMNKTIDFAYGFNILTGIIFNSLIIIVCFKSNLRKIPTFIFYAFGALTSSLSLFGQPLNNFLHGFILGYNPREKYLIWCKMVFFINVFTVQWNVWLLVGVQFKS